MTKERGLQQALGFVPQAVLWLTLQWQPPCPSLLGVECEVPSPCASSTRQPGPCGSWAADSAVP